MGNFALWIVVIGVFTLIVMAPITHAEESAVYQWQKNRLMNPSEKTLQYEKDNQLVFIYEGLTLSDVEKALDQNFDRVEHMMFIKTQLPHTAAGVPQKENDGCD